MPDVITFDFETHPIRQRPHYPPRPVGCAFKFPGMESFYVAHGHPSGNNGTWADMMGWLDKAWQSKLPLLCHNAKFDVSIAVEGLGLPMLPWHRLHDTMFLGFLADPHSRKIGLKPMAADLLGWAQDERDAVEDWIMAHKDWVKQAAGWPENVKKSNAGAFIGYAPGDIVGPYAVGDVDRTYALFEHLLPLIERNGMAEAYDRERQVMPIFMENERQGLRVDVENLERDCETYEIVFAQAEDMLRRELRASGLNFDADRDVASVLVERGVIAEADFVRTKSGALSTSKDNMRPEIFTGTNGQWVASMLGYRNRLKTCLTMFMQPWLAQARETGGWIHTNWNQTRGGDHGGTRTGRPSTFNHNFLNIAKSFDGRDDGFVMPGGAPPLPLCRRYVLSDEGEILLDRDFSGQELRVFAHFEQGDLWRQYVADPKVDVHAFVGARFMESAKRDIDRTSIKVMNFQGIYGGGAPALSKKLRVSHDEAKRLKAFHDKALPGRRTLNEEITRVIRRGDPIRTWGGRLYFEEPRGADGRSKIYKLLNYIVQGSAADLTKQTMIDWYSDHDRNARLLMQVYDELLITAPIGDAERQMQVLKKNMETDRLSVPMLSDGKRGAAWGTMEKCE